MNPTDNRVVRRVLATPEQQQKLSIVFAKKNPDGTLKPLNLSTVSNYLNETRYPNPKACELREYAVKMLGCKWQTLINE